MGGEPARFEKKYGLDIRVNHEVTGIDTEKALVEILDRKTGRNFTERYDRLMLATGARPFVPDIEGTDSGGIFGVNTLQSGLDLFSYMENQRPEKAVVIGGGYIGLEMAENLLKRGLSVSLIDRSREVMGTLDEDMGRLVSEALENTGVKLFRNESLEGFNSDRGRVREVVTDRRTLQADLVVMGLGVRPETSIFHKTGIKLGETGAVAVNDTMKTNIENIWAGGDCAESFHLVSRRPVNIALGTIANKHGRVAGANMAGKYEAFPGVVGTAVSKICDVEVARTGLQEKEIEQIGKQCVSARIDSRTRAGYYPDAGPITVKILAEKHTGRLLGGQIVGKEGAAKRIDIIATALHAGMDIHEMTNLDLSYAPPYSPVWDPVLIAARIAAKQL